MLGPGFFFTKEKISSDVLIKLFNLKFFGSAN